jgi:hypothetical protein
VRRASVEQEAFVRDVVILSVDEDRKVAGVVVSTTDLAVFGSHVVPCVVALVKRNNIARLSKATSLGRRDTARGACRKVLILAYLNRIIAAARRLRYGGANRETEAVIASVRRDSIQIGAPRVAASSRGNLRRAPGGLVHLGRFAEVSIDTVR